MLNQDLISITRAGLTESRHFGSIAVTDKTGRLLYAAGEPERVTFIRSSAKPLQAIPVVESGALERFNLTDEELAFMCSSHNGEPEHVALAAGMLAKLSLGPDALLCGAHEPFYKPATDALLRAGDEITSLHNNCSGKHSGMLALALMLNAPIGRYLEPEHAVQRSMRAAVSAMSGVAESDIPLGIDGCGVPVFALPLAALATAYARLGSPEGLLPERADACRRITAAIRRYPRALAGTGRYDTRLAEATGGRLIGKLGAEGVFAVAVAERDWGIAVKIEDGANRALYPAVTETLRQLGLLSEAESEALAEIHPKILRNWQGTEVGEIRPQFNLQRLS
ncbi:asparaginase [Gorillibacterium massiliense]|uniref:asparaginase n=1 Tax=Gorillibacterium massiliense TaxID=1280390 RepID=UPI0004B9883E|nr:asparaginase [Gorillibacterium massiliense]